MIKRLFWFAIGSLIAMLICFNEVYAYTVPNLMTQVIQNGNTQNVTTTNNAWIATGRFFITVSNNGYSVTNNDKTIPNYFWIRYCQQNENGKIKNLEGISVNSTYGDPLNTRVLYTNVPCTPYGTNLTGIEVYIEMKVGPGRGYYAGIDLDQGGAEIFNVYIEMRAEADSYIGLGELYYGYSNSPLHTSDIVDEEIKNQEAFISNQQEQIDQFNKYQEWLENSQVNDNEIISKFDLFNSVLEENGTITNLMILPITLWTNIYDSVGQECRPFNLGNMLGTNITLPCLNIKDVLGTTLWNIIDVLFTGFFIFVISKKMILVFDKFSSLQEGDVISD